MSATALTDIIPDWLAGMPNTTRQAYRGDLRQFTDWLAATPISAVDRRLAQRWIVHLEEQGLADSTIQRKRSAVSSFYSYAISIDGWAKPNPFAHVRVPKGGGAHRLGLDAATTKKLIAASKGEGPEMFAFISLLVTTGCRISGACQSRIEDLAKDRDHQVLTITLKGGRTKRIPLSPNTHQAITAAIGERTSGPIFVHPRTGNAFNRDTAGRWITRLGSEAGLGHITPHILRHTAATLALADGADVVMVQQLLGHQSIQSTMNYLHAIQGLDNSPAYQLDKLLYDEEEE